jgi:hypothetical protein
MSAMESHQVQMMFHDFAMEDEGLLAMLAEPMNQKPDSKRRCPAQVSSSCQIS